MGNTFLKSNKYVSEEEIRFQGTPLLDTYDEGLDYLAAHMPRYVRLFASLLSREMKMTRS